MSITIALGICAAVLAGPPQPPRAERRAAEDPRPIVGAIRWDAWYGEGSPVQEVQRNLGPAKYHFRLPFFGKVVARSEVHINGDSQAIVDREIAYASDAGLNYWAFVYYDDTRNRSSTRNLGIALRRYLASKDKKGVRFCLIHEGPRIDRCAAADWSEQRVPRMVTLMKDPNYQTVLGGRPLLFVFRGPKHNGKQRFEELGDAAVAAGLKRPYCVLMGWQPEGDAKEMQTLGFDAVSAYSAGPGYTMDLWSYERVTEYVRDSYWQYWRQHATACITFAAAGWDPRPRIERPGGWWSGGAAQGAGRPPAVADARITATPEQLANHVRDAIQWTRANRDLNPANAVIIYAWDENDEGGWLIPTLNSDGTADTNRLDALRRVLRPGRLGTGSSFSPGTIGHHHGVMVGMVGPKNVPVPLTAP